MSPVLLLDATWRIDRVIGAERACELLLEGRVVAASDDIAAVMRSPSTSVTVPSVVARVGAAHPRSARPPICSPRRVRARDEHICQFIIDGIACDRRGDTVDHLTPRSSGGQSSWHNLVAACRMHNGAKADRDLAEMTRRYGWMLRRDPFAPTHGALLTVTLRAQHPSWEPFLAA